MTPSTNKTSVITRLAEPQDVAALVKIINYAYRGGKEQKSWTGEEHLISGARVTQEELLELMSTTGKHLLVAESLDGQVVGCVVCETDGPEAYTGMLAVDPDVQSGGIGSSLMTAAHDRARQLGKASSMMTVLCGRPELQSWYERLGYKPTGETKPFPAGGDSRWSTLKPDLYFVVMRKQL